MPARGRRPAGAGRQGQRRRGAPTPATRGAAVTGRIDFLGRGGDGLLALDGRRLAVPGTVPGDLVRVRPTAEAGRRDEAVPAAELEALLEPGPDRVAPPCPHASRPEAPGCGGCRMQMLRWEAYLDWKAGLARQALARAGLAPAIIAEPEVAPQRSRRRAGFAVQAIAGGCVAGFRLWRSHRIADLSDACLVCVPELVGLLPHLRALGADLLAPGRGLSADATLTESGLDLVLAGPLADADWSRLVAFATDADLARLSLAAGTGPAPETVLTRRRPVLQFGPVAVTPPAGGFLQAVSAIEGRMQATIAAWLGDAGRVLDLYAGCGTLSLPLLAHQAVIHAVDADARALDALQAAADAAGQGSRVTVRPRDLGRFPLVGPDLAGFDAAILDPPRQGAAAQAAAIAADGRQLRRIAAVSCNPVSLARDLATLGRAGWQVAAVHLYDQFLWTPHLELVALLERGR